MRRILVPALAGVLAVGLAGAAQAIPAAHPANRIAATTTSAAAVSAAASKVSWGACPDPSYASYGIQCAAIKVPLDYSHPNGRKITLEISRRAHTSSAKNYRGIILINPGGPGGSGLSMPILQKYVPGSSAGRYDWIGFDPRGVGASKPALHCNNKLFGADRPDFVPSTRKLMHYWRTITRNYAKACGNSSARRLLPHMTTADNARDMNQIRKALGQKKMSYYGFSWGSYLGQVFAQLFPKRVDRMILDGVVDPSRVWYGANLDQDKAFDSNMNVYWHYLANHNSAFHLGTSWKKVKRGFTAELRKLRKHPAANGRLGPDELTDAMLDAGYYVFDWVERGDSYSALIRHNDGTALYNDYASGSSGVGNENGYAVYDAVQCTDNPWPGWAKTLRDTRRLNRTAPFLTWDNAWFNAPCLNWPVKAQHRLRITGHGLTSKILLISETKDAATPYSGALEVRKRYRTASLIAGVGGTTHAGSLSGVGCVDNTIARYLATGKVPARKRGNRADKLCPHVPRPQPGSSSARMAPARQLPAVLRQALEAAQAGFIGG